MQTNMTGSVSSYLVCPLPPNKNRTIYKVYFSNFFMKQIILLALLMPFAFAQSVLSGETLPDCFFPSVQISLPGQVNSSAISMLGENAVESAGYIYLLDSNASRIIVSIYSDGSFTYLDFDSDNIAEINSRLEYINSLNLILVEDSSNLQAKLSSNLDSSCRQIFPQRFEQLGAVPPAKMPTPAQVPVSDIIIDSGIGVASVPPVEGFGAEEAGTGLVRKSNSGQEEDGYVSGSISLEAMIFPMALGSISTLFLIVAAVYFRGQFFKPVDYPQQITLGKTQLEILEEIGDSSKIPTDIALRLKKSKSTVIEHLCALQSMGFVEKVSEPGRKFVYYRLSSSGRRFLIAKGNAA